MPQRLLHYVSGVRLMVDRFDTQRWHFAIQGHRYDLRTRGGSYLLATDDGMVLGRYTNSASAIAAARDHVHAAITEPIPLIPVHAVPGMR